MILLAYMESNRTIKQDDLAPHSKDSRGRNTVFVACNLALQLAVTSWKYVASWQTTFLSKAHAGYTSLYLQSRLLLNCVLNCLFYKNTFTQNIRVHFYSHKHRQNSSLVIWLSCCSVNFHNYIYTHGLDSNILHSYPRNFAALWCRIMRTGAFQIL